MQGHRHPFRVDLQGNRLTEIMPRKEARKSFGKPSATLVERPQVAGFRLFVSCFSTTMSLSHVEVESGSWVS